MQILDLHVMHVDTSRTSSLLCLERLKGSASLYAPLHNVIQSKIGLFSLSYYAFPALLFYIRLSALLFAFDLLFIPCVEKKIESCYIEFHYCERFAATIVFEFHTIYNILNRKNVINQSTI